MSKSNHTHSEPVAQDDILIQFLRERDVACPLCRYNLRNLRATICPECGNALSLSLDALNSGKAAWVGTLTATGIIAAIGLLFAVMLTVDMTEGNRHAVQLPAYIVMTVGYAGPLLPIIIALFRRRFAQMRPRRRVSIAFGVSLMHMAVLGLSILWTFWGEI